MAWERRLKDGLAQYRETDERAGRGRKSRWLFRIISFDSSVEGRAGFCNVENAEGKATTCPIDASSRIAVAGRRYGRDQWMH